MRQFSLDSKFLVDKSLSPTEIAERVEEREIVKQALSRITPANRDLLVRYWYAECRLRKIGKELGLSHQAVGKRLQLALDDLLLRLIEK